MLLNYRGVCVILSDPIAGRMLRIAHGFDNLEKIHHIQHTLHPRATIRNDHLNQALNWL